MSLTLNESIDMNFTLKVADMPEEFNLVVKRNGVELTEEQYTVIVSGGRYRIRISVNADKMCDEITVQAVDAAGNALSQERTESVRSYVLLSLASDKVVNEEKCALIRMLDYGSLAQKLAAEQKGETVADYANSVLTAEHRALIDAIVWPEATAAADSAEGSKSGSKFGVSITANETIDMNLLIAKSEMKEGYYIQVKQAGKVLTEGQYQLSETADGRIRVRVSVTSDKMNDIISVQVMKADGTPAYDARSLSVRHYVSMNLGSSSTATEKGMLIALLDYGTLVQMMVEAKGGAAVTDPSNRYITAEQRAQYDIKWN